MDATVATGAAAMMAIRVLLDHSVPEQNIILVSLLMAEQGLSKRIILIFFLKKSILNLNFFNQKVFIMSLMLIHLLKLLPLQLIQN